MEPDTRRLKILFVIDSFHMGGAEKSLVTLLGLLPYKDMDIEVMRTADGGELQPLVPRDVRLTRLSLRPAGPIGYIKYMASRVLMRCARSISGRDTHPNDLFWRFMRHSIPQLKGEYDTAIAYQQGLPTAYVATRVKARRKIAWVNADVKGAGYDARFNMPFYRAMDSIVTVSDTLRTLFSDRYPSLASRVITIRDIIDPDAIKRLADGPSPYDDSSSSSGRPLRLLTVARMEHIKGTDLAIGAARLLRDAGLHFHWHFIGDGSERTHIVSLIDRYDLHDNITLHGTVTNPYPWISGCDIYIQPSRHEGYGMAIVEAMTLHRPVITTDFPVAHDHIDGTNGLIAPMSPQGIADAVTRLADPSRRQEISRRLADVQTDCRSSLSKVYKLLK